MFAFSCQAMPADRIISSGFAWILKTPREDKVGKVFDIFMKQ